jgi:electron transfer flavoprotein alpha subunit
MKAGIVVIAEISADGLTPASREVISFSGRLAESAGEAMLVLVPGGIQNPEAEEIAAAAGCDVAVLVGDHLSAYGAEAWIACLSPVCREINPRFICIPHTSRGWDYGPGLAIRLGASLIGAVEGFRLHAGNFVFKRSFLKGQWQMEVIPEKWPAILTILPEAKGTEEGAPHGAASSAASGGRPPRVSFLSIPAKTFRTIPLGRLPAPETAYDFSEAEVIVAAGKGIGTAENIDLIKRLAGVFPKSAVGCSRAVCDLGWMEHRRQIGMTGRTVAPPLYIACGISGAMPHLAGMRNSRCIIAVNRDKNAAIFQVAHLGVVEDLLTFIPAVLEQPVNKKQENSDG